MVVAEFPEDFLPFLRCNRDAGELSVLQIVKRGSVGLVEARLKCKKCGYEYPIENGIARLITESLTSEAQLEIALKNSEYEALPAAFVPPSWGWRSSVSDAIEIPPHLEELGSLEGQRVLEIGCGDGRFTVLMAERGAEVLALDFSLAGLQKLASNLASGVAPTSYQQAGGGINSDFRERVGLVQADASCFHVAPRSFDRALSATPCDSRDERMQMYRSVADSLTDEGCYVAGVEYDDLNRKLLGLPRVRRYTPGGVLIEHLDVPGMRREIAPYFSNLRFRLIRPHVPFARKLPERLRVLIARAVSRIPVLRHLGEILLVRARRPIRCPNEGARRPGNRLAIGFYRAYKRWKGETPLWDSGVSV